ncbi:uncharacterized protein LOC118188621 [Stegodyphus dumicola]|uniref:uncharacterized protein LOC118188621 n=1 Tax=Stegodyphus dumicola TaxID=202533 RepID=UPI0015B1BF25|nr:uncharacterized protein LOC118188621 [Stegodyphus dumicola]
MTWCKTVVLLLLITAVADLCSGLVLERLPRHVPLSSRYSTAAEDEVTRSFDSSVEKRKITESPTKFMNKGQLAPLFMKPTWKAIYPFTEKRLFRSHRKRAASEHNRDQETEEKERNELVDILKDEEQEERKEEKKNEKKESSRHIKTKRQSSDDTGSKDEIKGLATVGSEEQEEAAPKEDFQEWLRREYYRNMARSFASMRRKRDGSSYEEPGHSKTKISSSKREKKSKKPISFEEVTDNLRAIEDVLFLDALQTIKDAGDDYDDDVQRQNRINNDLSSAYDLETMRNALFRLRDTLGNMESESMPDDDGVYMAARKRSDKCPPLDLLTSDCFSLGDIVSDEDLKRLLLHACNWHEVCYTCGGVYGLTSENCDVGFIEQGQTICNGDVPCESTTSLLLLPLRQRRVFYKRSNPSVCLVDPCVEAFLRQV